MKKHTQPLASPPPPPASGVNKQTLLLLLLGGTLGALVMWLSMQPPKAATPASLSQTDSGTSSASVDGPPSVSGLTPEQAAMVLGNWHYDHKEWTQAISQYESAIRLGMDNPDIRTDLGNSYRFLGQPEKALDLYLEAQRQNPMHENSLLNEAGLYAEVLNQPAKAALLANDFIRRFPNSPRIMRAQEVLALTSSRPGIAARPDTGTKIPNSAPNPDLQKQQLEKWLKQDSETRPANTPAAQAP